MSRLSQEGGRVTSRMQSCKGIAASFSGYSHSGVLEKSDRFLNDLGQHYLCNPNGQCSQMDPDKTL